MKKYSIACANERRKEQIYKWRNEEHKESKNTNEWMKKRIKKHIEWNLKDLKERVEAQILES